MRRIRAQEIRIIRDESVGYMDEDSDEDSDEGIEQKWEIVDNTPFKNRIINVGDPTEIYIDKLTFQG